LRSIKSFRLVFSPGRMLLPTMSAPHWITLLVW